MINREKLVKNYFTKKLPVGGVILAVLGLLFLFGGGVKFGLFLIIIGGLILAFGYFLKKAATDEEVDKLLEEEMIKLVDKGLDKFGLVAEEVDLIEPITIKGAYQVSLNKDVHPMYRRGKDNELRYSLVKGVIFYFSENQVYCYTCVFDLVTGGHFIESTDEYFYKDIVSVSTTSERIEVQLFNNKNKFGGLVGGLSKAITTTHDVEQFRLTTSGGTYISATIKDAKLLEQYKAASMSQRSTEDKIKAMRNLLRERKAV